MEVDASGMDGKLFLLLLCFFGGDGHVVMRCYNGG